MENRTCRNCFFDEVKAGGEPCVRCLRNGGHSEQWIEYNRFLKPNFSQYDAEFGEPPDLVNNPSHYTSFKIQPITFIMENHLPFHTGNIIKYACRAGNKLYPDRGQHQSEIIDLQKVIRYAEMRINQIRGMGVLGEKMEEKADEE